MYLKRSHPVAIFTNLNKEIFTMSFFLIFLVFGSWSYAQEAPPPPPPSPKLDFQAIQKPASPFIGKKTGVPIAQARPQDITPENYPYKLKELNFPNASLQDVIKTMSVNMNINLIMDPALGHTQKISITSYLPLTLAEYYQAFLSILALHNLAVIRSGPFLKVVSSDTALKSNLRVHTEDKNIKTDQFLTSIIKLKHIDADSLQAKIKPFIDEKSVKSLIVYPPSNAVIISDYGSNLNKIRRIIKSLDIPSQDSIFEVLPIKHAQAKTLVGIISKLLPSQKRGYSRYSRNVKGKPSSGGQAVNISSLSHDERTNSIIVMGNKAGVNQVKDLVRRLDYYTNPDLAGGIYVYKVKHGTAEDLSDTLNQLMGKSSSKSRKGKRPTPQMANRLGSFAAKTAGLQNTSTALAFEDIKIIAEKNTNSLLIVANRNNYQNILNILKKVDISRNQVFVKSIIMEMNTEKNNDWKIANYFFPQEGEGIARMGYGLSNFTDITNSAGGSATLLFPLSVLLGKSFSSSDKTNISKGIKLGSPNANNLIPDSLEVPTLSSFIQFLQKNVGANILSTPQVMALDHQKAEVSIVDRIPIITSTTASLNNQYAPTTSTGKEDVETTLIITPHINPDVNSIRLEIEQKIDDIMPSARVPAELQNTNVAIKKRSIKTFITLKDKETAVLGGLVRESSNKTEAKVPILGDLPLIGWLFKNSETKRRKTNLIVFVTPHIVRSAKEHSHILSSKLKERMNFVRKFTGNEDPYKEEIDKMQQSDQAETSSEPLLEPNSIEPSLSDQEKAFSEEEEYEEVFLDEEEDLEMSALEDKPLSDLSDKASSTDSSLSVLEDKPLSDLSDNNKNLAPVEDIVDQNNLPVLKETPTEEYKSEEEHYKFEDPSSFPPPAPTI